MFNCGMTILPPPLRQAWRLIPRRARRALFIKAYDLAVRSFPPPTVARPPVAVAGVLRSASGLGESARLSLAALQDAGIDCSAADLSDSLLGTGDLGQPLNPSTPSARPGPGALILHVSGPFVPYALHWLGRPLVEGKRIIGVWHWELPRLPAEWRVGCRLVHEIWTPSAFVASAVRQEFAGPVRIIPHAVSLPENLDPLPWREMAGQGFLAVTMFNMASGFERKNPLAVIKAFRHAFGDDPKACLIVKMMHGGVWPEGLRQLRAAIDGADNIKLVTQTLTRQQVFSLLAAADTVMSLHRSEGFGLLAAEAMVLGKPVIVSDWSSTAEFLNRENGCPVPCRLIPAVDPQGNYHFPDQSWAEPDIRAAAEWLRRLRDNPELRLAIGHRAREGARQFSSEVYAARLNQAFSLP